MSARRKPAYVAGSRGGENGWPGTDAAQFGVRTTRPRTSIRLRAAAATLRSIAPKSNRPCVGSTRSHAISKRSDSTTARRMFALSAPRFTVGVSRTPLTMTPKKPRGVVRATAAPGAARASDAASSVTSGTTRRMARDPREPPGRYAPRATGPRTAAASGPSGRGGAGSAAHRAARRPPPLCELGVGEAQDRAAGPRLEAVHPRALPAPRDLHLADLAQVDELDPELLAHLAPDRRHRRLAAAPAAARQLPGASITVRVADEQDAVAVADDALDPERVGAADEPPDAQARVGGPVAEALERDRARVAQLSSAPPRRRRGR